MKSKTHETDHQSAVLRHTHTHSTDSKSVKIKRFDDRNKFKILCPVQMQAQLAHMILGGIKDCGVSCSSWCAFHRVGHRANDIYELTDKPNQN